MNEVNNDGKKDAKEVVLDFVKRYKKQLIVLGVGGTLAAIKFLDPSIATPIVTTITSLTAAEGLYKIFSNSDEKKKETARMESAQAAANETANKATLAPAMVSEVALSEVGESKVAENVQDIRSGDNSGLRIDKNSSLRIDQNSSLRIDQNSGLHIDQNHGPLHLITNIAEQFCNECAARCVSLRDGCKELADWASAGMVMEPEAVMGMV